MAIKTFTTGEVLTASDTNTYLTNAGLVVVSTTTVPASPASSTVVVYNCFSSTYDNYKIVYMGGQSSASCHLTIQLSGITTGVYYGGIMYVSSSPGSVQVAGVNAQTSWTYSGMMRGSSLGGQLDFELHGPFLSNCRTRVNAPYVRDDDQGFGTFTGIVESTASATGFTLATTTGTFTGGQIVVYGYRKA
jgi:hypothetical protein